MKAKDERIAQIATEKNLTGDTIKLWVGDGRQSFEIYSVPVEALVLNVDNRRFRAERLMAEDLLGRPLDPENNPDDERTIESLLLDTSHKIDGDRIVGKETADSEALKNDWLRRRQDTPFWIRPDGTVRNGNRRLAINKRLARSGGASGLDYVDAIILTEDQINEPRLLELEHREQLTENFKVRYNDIDYLLAVREAAVARDIDWFDAESIDTVAGELQGLVEQTKSEVIRDLYAIKYMDVFLEEAGQSGEYHRLIRTLERFRDIGRTMVRAESEDPIDADRVLQVSFSAVRAGLPHGDIRKIRQMYLKDRERFDQLAVEIEELEEEWVTDGPQLTTPLEEEVLEGAEEEEEEGEGPGPEVINYPKVPVRKVISVAIDGYESSQEADMLQILREVLNRLEVVSDVDAIARALEEPERGDEVRTALGQILRWAEAVSGLLKSGD